MWNDWKEGWVGRFEGGMIGSIVTESGTLGKRLVQMTQAYVQSRSNDGNIDLFVFLHPKLNNNHAFEGPTWNKS